jgi:eukaryotic-like serine/threonine-protein kinase
MSQDPLIGSVIGGARIQDRVSKGLLAMVYRGHYERLGIPVAVKVLTPKAMAQGMNKERFMREGRALAQLSHPNIIKIYNVGHEQNRYFIIMDWIQDGMNLRQLAQSRPLTPPQSLKVIQRLAEALDYIHQRGLIHRDIKPANVCLRRGGHPVLMDFSLIKDEESDVQLTAPGTIMGTVNFMPPEQAQPGGPFGNVSARSDVYSLGGTLYWLLTGKPPFNGRTPMETIIKLMREQPDPPSKFNASIPQVIDALVLRALSKKQDERPSSARDLINEIDQLFQQPRPELESAQRPALAEAPAARAAPPKSASHQRAKPSPGQKWGSGSSTDQQRPVEEPQVLPQPEPEPVGAIAQPASAAAPAAAHAPAPVPKPAPTFAETADGEDDLAPSDPAGAYAPAFSTEQAAAGQLKLPPELLAEQKKTSVGLLVGVSLLVVGAVTGILVFVWVVILGRPLPF